MNRIILSLALVLLHSSGFSMETVRGPGGKPKSYYSLEKFAEMARPLENVAHRYQDYLNRMGQKETGDVLPAMLALFTPNIKKFVNGKLVATTIEGLREQILKAKTDEKDGVGTWSVNEASCPIANLEKNTVVAHFEIPTEKKGTIVVMKKLICEQDRIKEIKEVFNFKTE
jgi:hypothetical protein